MDNLESDFNLKSVLVSFKQCLNEKEEVLLDHYLTGWKGLVRCVQGPVWGQGFLATLPTHALCPARADQAPACPGLVSRCLSPPSPEPSGPGGSGEPSPLHPR